jgi:hypothetical protein
VLPWSAIKKKVDTHWFLQTGVSSKVQKSDMDDDGSSEADFIFAPPIAAFNAFGTAWVATVTLVFLIGGSLQPRHRVPAVGHA